MEPARSQLTHDAPRQAAPGSPVAAGAGSGEVAMVEGVEGIDQPQKLVNAPPKIQSENAKNDKENSVENSKKIQSPTSGKTTEKRDDDWRFEIKRKPRNASRKNSGSTAKREWYYWVVRVNRESGVTVYYGTLDVLDAVDPNRLKKYWRRSK